jgi:hypothetical protein
LAKFEKAALSKVTGAVMAGAEEAWPVDPILRRVHVFRRGRDAEVLTAPHSVKSAVLDGFVLKCGPVWAD